MRFTEVMIQKLHGDENKPTNQRFNQRFSVNPKDIKDEFYIKKLCSQFPLTSTRIFSNIEYFLDVLKILISIIHISIITYIINNNKLILNGNSGQSDSLNIPKRLGIQSIFSELSPISYVPKWHCRQSQTYKHYLIHNINFILSDNLLMLYEVNRLIFWNRHLNMLNILNTERNKIKKILYVLIVWYTD